MRQAEQNQAEIIERPESTGSSPTSPQSIGLSKILQHLRMRFPDQSDDNLLTMILEVKRNNNNSLKNMSMNRINFDIQNLIINSILDKECAICCEEFQDDSDDIMKMKCCKKKICRNCIKNCQKNRRECPFCRTYTILDEEYPALR